MFEVPGQKYIHPVDGCIGHVQGVLTFSGRDDAPCQVQTRQPFDLRATGEHRDGMPTQRLEECLAMTGVRVALDFQDHDFGGKEFAFLRVPGEELLRHPPEVGCPRRTGSSQSEVSRQMRSLCMMAAEPARTGFGGWRTWLSLLNGLE